ncbi:hypothetical protein Tco_1281948 [Tanacetum coccineum]
MNVANSSTSPTPLIDKIGKFEDLLTSGQAILVDEAGNPLKKVEFSGDYDSEDEVALVDNDMARFIASERVGFGTQSLLEQWRDSYGNGDYDENTYDDDMYEGQDLPQEIQAICDNLDIRVRGNDSKPDFDSKTALTGASPHATTPEIVEKMMKKITAMNVVRVLKVVTSADERSSWIAAAVAMVNGRKRKESVMKWSEFVLQIMSA